MGVKTEDPTLYELVSSLIPENKLVPGRANVAARTREAMDRDVRERNPEWWQREQQRQAEAARRAAARGDTTRRAAQAGVAQQPCVPQPASPTTPTPERR